MSSTPPTSAEQPRQSSGSEKTPDSETPRIKRAKTTSSKSPTLQAFHLFEESLTQFQIHVLSKIDLVGHDDVDTMKALLKVLDRKCEILKNQIEGFISRLDKAIESYEAKKPTDLAAHANSVISKEVPTRNRSSLFKGNQTIAEMFAVLIQSIGNLSTVIGKKILTSIYEDYSFLMEKKLKNLKKMCETIKNEIEPIGKLIKSAIEENEGLRRSNGA